MKDFNTNKKRNDDYYTPNYVLDHICKFDYDPCTTIERAKTHNIKNFDTIESNGLLRDWTKYKCIWVNPPFTNKYDFLKKAIETYKTCKNNIFILLPINYLITKEFNSLESAWILYIPNKRINFETKNGVTSNCSFGSVILKPSLHNELYFITL